VTGNVTELTDGTVRSVDAAMRGRMALSAIPAQEVLSMKPESAAKMKYGV
jgi:hypothetical protein